MFGAIGEAVGRLIVALSLLLLVGAAIYWYFGIYDTAAGKCSRGDLGACMVYEAQQQAETRRILQQVGAGLRDNTTPEPTIDYCYSNCPDAGDVPGNGDVPQMPSP